MHRRRTPHLSAVLFLGLFVSAAVSPSARAASADTLNTQGRTRLQVFGGLYGAYLGVVIPLAAEADDAAFYSLSLMTLPWIGYTGAGSFAAGRGMSRGDAMTVSSLTTLGAWQGHLWHAASDNTEAEANAAAGLFGSLAGFTVGSVVASSSDLSEGHAAAIGAGNWWGIALGGLAANDEEDESDDVVWRGRAVGSAAGAAIGALGGHRLSLADVRYIHLGGLLGWVYAAGLNVLNDPSQRGASYTQLAGISTGMAATYTASKLGWASPDQGRVLDHSGRLRLLFFSLTYGTYLATVVPIAAGVEFDDDNRKTFALTYMHVPTGGVLATTYLTRNIDVTQSAAITTTSLAWFGAAQGALWAAASHADEEATSASSIAGSGAGIAAAAIVANKASIGNGHAAMLGAGNWWGAALGFLGGSALLGEDSSGEEIAAATAAGSAAGLVVGASIGGPFTVDRVNRLHMGGFLGWLTGTASLLTGGSIGFRAAMTVMTATTAAGLVVGGRAASDESTDTSLFQEVQPYMGSSPGENGRRRTLVGISSRF